jgi:hypothetical protein
MAAFLWRPWGATRANWPQNRVKAGRHPFEAGRRDSWLALLGVSELAYGQSALGACLGSARPRRATTRASLAALLQV